MTVFLKLSTCCRSSERPRHIVLIFQLASCKNCFFCCEPGARFTSACHFSPSSKHLVKQADWGGSAPNCLGVAQLEVGSSWPVGLQSSLPPSDTTHSTQTYTNWSGLLTHNCCLLCSFCCCEQQHWSDLSEVQARVNCMEILGCPVVRIPLSASLMWSKGEQSSTFGINMAAGAAGRNSKLTIQLP